jgi:hypothetical protein
MDSLRLALIIVAITIVLELLGVGRVVGRGMRAGSEHVSGGREKWNF